MKKESVMILCLFFVILISVNVFAMKDPIVVKATPGYFVEMWVWTAGGGPLITSKDGYVDSNGILNVTLFSLMDAQANFQIVVMDNNKEKVRENMFENRETDVPYLIDCISDCKMSVYKGEKLFEETNTTIPVSNISVSANSTNNSDSNNSDTNLHDFSNKSVDENFISDFFSGKSIFTTEDGHINSVVVMFGIVVVVIILLILFFALRKKKTKKDPEEKVLEELESEIEKKAEELRRIKEINLRRLKIEEAKKRLASEEKQIQIYRELNPEERMRRKRLEEAQRKLNEEEKEIMKLKEENKGMENAGNSEMKKDDLYRRLDNMEKSKTSYSRNEVRNSPAVKGFVDNMRRTGATEGDKKN